MFSKVFGFLAASAFCTSALVAEGGQRRASPPSAVHELDDAQSLARAYAAIVAAEEALRANPEARAAFGELLKAARRQLDIGVAKTIEILPASPESGDSWPVEFVPEHARRPSADVDARLAKLSRASSLLRDRAFIGASLLATNGAKEF